MQLMGRCNEDFEVELPFYVSAWSARNARASSASFRLIFIANASNSLPAGESMSSSLS